jgi:hypothetical protein
VAAQRRLFPTPDGGGDEDLEACRDGVISYVPHTNGFDDSAAPKTAEDWTRRRRVTAESLLAIVTCIPFHSRRTR